MSLSPAIKTMLKTEILIRKTESLWQPYINLLENRQVNDHEWDRSLLENALWKVRIAAAFSHGPTCKTQKIKQRRQAGKEKVAKERKGATVGRVLP